MPHRHIDRLDRAERTSNLAGQRDRDRKAPLREQNMDENVEAFTSQPEPNAVDEASALREEPVETDNTLEDEERAIEQPSRRDVTEDEREDEHDYGAAVEISPDARGEPDSRSDDR